MLLKMSDIHKTIHDNEENSDGTPHHCTRHHLHHPTTTTEHVYVCVCVCVNVNVPLTYFVLPPSLVRNFLTCPPPPPPEVGPRFCFDLHKELHTPPPL
jgi:hypothetical protein